MDNLDAGLVARWSALPAAGLDSARMLCVGTARGAYIGPYIRIVSPHLLAWYDQLAEQEHEGSVEPWPRWWETPGGAEEPSARERLG